MFLTQTITKVLPIPSTASMVKVAVWTLTEKFDEGTGVEEHVVTRREDKYINLALVCHITKTTLIAGTRQYVKAHPDLSFQAQRNSLTARWGLLHGEQLVATSEVDVMIVRWIPDLRVTDCTYITFIEETPNVTV